MTTDNIDPWDGLEVHPGYTLRQEIEARGMSQRELAARMGRPEQIISDIVNGKKTITPATALELEPVLGIPAQYWVKLVTEYSGARARAVERVQLEAQVPLLKEFRYNELVKRGWIEPVKGKIEQVKSLCTYLGVASLNQHQAILPAAFRITGPANFSDRALASWLRQGELLARDMDLPPFDRLRFLEVLPVIRTFTADLPKIFYPKMVDQCSSAGVAFVVAQELPKIGANGVTRWLNTGNPLVQLNLKQKWADIFWFTFFHEAGHVLQPRKHDVMHYTRRRDAANLPYETEANDFAQDMLLPPSDWKRIKDELNTHCSTTRVAELASEVGIHPGIVVGRLQHERVIHFSQMNDLRELYRWGS